MELDDLLEGEGLDAAGLEDALAWARRRAAELCQGVEQDPELGPLLDGAAPVSNAPLSMPTPGSGPATSSQPAEAEPGDPREEPDPGSSDSEADALLAQEPEAAVRAEAELDDGPADAVEASSDGEAVESDQAPAEVIDAAPSEVAQEAPELSSPIADEILGDDDGFGSLEASRPDEAIAADGASESSAPVDDQLLGDDSGFDAEPSPSSDEILGDDSEFDALASAPEDEILAGESPEPAADGQPAGDESGADESSLAAEDGNRFGLPEDPPSEDPTPQERSPVEAALASVPDPYDEETYLGAAPTAPEPQTAEPEASPEDEVAAAQAEVEAAAAAVAQLEAQQAVEAQQAAESEPPLDPLAGIDFDDLPGDDEDFDDDGPGPLDAAMGDAANPFDGGEPTIAGMQALGPELTNHSIQGVDVTQSMQATDFDGIEVTERAMNPLLAGAPSEVADAVTHSMNPGDGSAQDAAPTEAAPAEAAPAEAAGDDEEEIEELDEFEFLDEDDLELMEEDEGGSQSAEEEQPEWKAALNSAQLGGGQQADEQSGLLRPPTRPPGPDEES